MEGVTLDMKYRITEKESIWNDDVRFYPEYRPKWWPLWFRFDDGQGYQISFHREESAQRFIEMTKEARRA
jgi:hypothetical protein